MEDLSHSATHDYSCYLLVFRPLTVYNRHRVTSPDRTSPGDTTRRKREILFFSCRLGKMPTPSHPDTIVTQKGTH